MAFEVESILRRLDEVKPERVEGIIKATARQLEEVARRDLGGARLVIRSLMPTDLGLTNEEWTEASGTDNTWAETTIADATIDDNTFIAIYGCRFASLPAADPPISAIRFTVGSAVKAIWNLYPLWVPYVVTTSGAAAYHAIAGIAETPIIVTQKIALTIEEFVVEATTNYKLAFDGLVVEKEGQKINA